MQEIDEKRTCTILAALAIEHGVLVFINANFCQQVCSLYSMSDYRFLFFFVILMPIAAAAILSTKGRRYGLILLLGLNPAFFLGSLYNRFFPVLPAGISIVSFGTKILFEVSYWFILSAESAMFIFAVKLFKKFHALRGL
jgi:hypothetical protein